VLQAAQVQRADALSRQRSVEMLEIQRQALSSGTEALRTRGLTPIRTDYEASRLQRQMTSPALQLPSDSQHHQVLMQRATDEMLGVLGRDAHALPPMVRAEAASKMIQRYAQQGLAAEPLRDVLLQRAADDTLRQSVDRVLTMQRLQEARVVEQLASSTLQLEHRALQRISSALEAEHREGEDQGLVGRVQARRGSGNPLPEAVKKHLELGLNANLSRVRIHDDAEADLLSRGVAAVAFTSGQDIFFRAGMYQPNTQTGLELLAHEVTHTVQQAQGQVGPGIDPDAGLEQQAQTMGARLARAPVASTEQTANPSAGSVPARPTAGPSARSRTAPLQRLVDPAAGKVDAAALHEVVRKYQVKVQQTGSLASPFVGVDAAANLRLGSARRLITSGGTLGGRTYRSLADGGVADPDSAKRIKQFQGELLAMLTRLKAAGRLDAALTSYQRQYGQSFSALLGEQVRDPNLRQRFLSLMPAPISTETLTKDAFIEQLAFGYAYNAQPADALNTENDEVRNHSDPHTILQAFGYRAGPPVTGHWGFQMRVFLPIPGKAKYPNPVVTFRGTEGVAFDLKANPEGTLDTLVGDFAPAGVGYNQYTRNHALIRLNVLAAAAHGPVIMAGHSLGGALAQIAATEFRDRTAEVVTFQGAGVSQQDLNKVLKYNAAHPRTPVTGRFYRVDGDIVPDSGETMLPGSVNYFDLVQRPAGSKAAYAGATLSYDTVDMTRIALGHTTPILTTYIRGQNPKAGLLAVLATAGVHGDDAGKDVGMIHGGSYTTDHDPRLNLEPGRRSKAAWAPNRITPQYEALFYSQIAYNTLLRKIEELARSKVYTTEKAFLTAATDYLATLGGSKRLPIRPEDVELGRQLHVRPVVADLSRPMEETTHTKRSLFAEMIEQGVPMTQPVVDALSIATLKNIWRSWHPEAQP